MLKCGFFPFQGVYPPCPPPVADILIQIFLKPCFILFLDPILDPVSIKYLNLNSEMDEEGDGQLSPGYTLEL